MPLSPESNARFVMIHARLSELGSEVTDAHLRHILDVVGDALNTLPKLNIRDEDQFEWLTPLENMVSKVAAHQKTLSRLGL